MNICPVNREWVYTHLMEAPLQGVELINRAWQGIDSLSLAPTKFSLRDRLIFLIQGIILLLPFVGQIVWLAWKILGNPKPLFDSYSREETPSPPVVLATPIGSVSPLERERNPSESFIYRETTRSASYEITWHIRPSDQETAVEQTCTQYTVTSTYLSERIQTFRYRSLNDPGKNFNLRLVGDQIEAQLNGQEPVFLKLPEPLPWIQHATLGFKGFALSNQMEMSFYGVQPNPFFSTPMLIKATARKAGFEAVEGFGGLMKVEVTPAGVLGLCFKGTMWFDPQTGVLRKFIESTPGGMTGVFVRNNQLPSLGHP